MARIGAGVRSAPERLGTDRRLLWWLAGIALLAFLIRLLPVVLSGGLDGLIDYDDGVYMGSALSLAHGRIVYRDFYMLHPPGILYVLSPFSALSLLTSDATAFAAARVGFMLLGALNTFLVGLISARLGRPAALAASALYAVWIVPAYVERSTWLIGPQSTLLLLAVLALTLTRSPAGETRPIGWRRAALVGVLIGMCGAIQIWGVVTAAVVFAWLVVQVARQPGGWLRPLAAYCIAGVATVAITFVPFLLAAGDKMIRIVIFDQIGRGVATVPISQRMRAMEGIPNGVVNRLGLHALPVVVFVVVVIAIAIVAWRRPIVRPWAALFAGQATLLLVTPSFFGHYSGWLAPVAALCIGAVFNELVAWTPALHGRAPAVGAVYAIGLAGFLAITLAPSFFGRPQPSKRIDWQAASAQIAGARCPTSDSPTVLIETGALRRMLNNACPLLVSPTGVSYDTDRDLPAKERSRPRQPEYQAIMRAYYGGSDAAVFIRKAGNNGLSQATRTAIRDHLPVERRVGPMTIYLPATP